MPVGNSEYANLYLSFVGYCAPFWLQTASWLGLDAILVPGKLAHRDQQRDREQPHAFGTFIPPDLGAHQATGLGLIVAPQPERCSSEHAHQANEPSAFLAPPWPGRSVFFLLHLPIIPRNVISVTRIAQDP